MCDCFYCAYAKRDKKGRFKDRCYGYSNCDFEEYAGPCELYLQEKILTLFEETVISKFTTVNECKAYRRGIADIVKILLDESDYPDCEEEYNKIIKAVYNKID